MGESHESLNDDDDDDLRPDEMGSLQRDLALLEVGESLVSLPLGVERLVEKSLLLVRASPIICRASVRFAGWDLERPIMLSSIARPEVDIDSF